MSTDRRSADRPGLDRRGFLRRAGLGTAAAGALAAGVAPVAGAQTRIPEPLRNLPGAAARLRVGTLLDYAAGPPAAAAVAAEGHLGAVRYCSNRRPGAEFMTGKPLRRPEVDDYRAHGLTVVSCYQFGKDATSDWRAGAAGGDYHAPIGIGIHADAGGPSGVPIYAAIDDNPSFWEFDNLIAPYLDRFGAHLAGAGLTLGVYANAPTIEWCRQRGLGRYFWQHDWGSAGVLHPATTIHQKAGNQRPVGGVSSDINDVYALDFGQWWDVDPLRLAASAFGSSR